LRIKIGWISRLYDYDFIIKEGRLNDYEGWNECKSDKGIRGVFANFAGVVSGNPDVSFVSSVCSP
jgi:hypothetical protein